MSQTSRTFRIFVSSTFSDLVAERNALQERVFPRLRELCQQHGARFQAIDLRWGVSNEASLDQQAMAICLGEIERCQQASPRPNFIVLLGDRYGWCPPPSQIPAAGFAGILGVIENAEDAALLKEWYGLDENAVPPEWQLKPRERESHYENYDNWQPVESRLHTILAAAAARLNLTDEERLPYTASATEQEIAAGALSVKEAPEHVLCFFRSIDDLPQHFDLAAKDFLDLDEKTEAIDEAAHRRQDSLKARLAAYVPGNVHSYHAHWTGASITTDHIDELCENVYAALERTILDEIGHPHAVVPAEEEVAHIRPDEALDAEGLAHHRFAEERLRFFVGRSEMLATIAGYLKDSPRRTLAIVGAGGTGKSALLARAIQQAQASHPKAQIVYRFIGATPGSSDGRSLLDSLCREISRRYGRSDADVPTDYRELVPELGKRLQLASADRPLVLFLDSLDQLSPSQGGRSLIWLPNEPPEHVSVIASTRGKNRSKLCGRSGPSKRSWAASPARRARISCPSGWPASTARCRLPSARRCWTYSSNRRATRSISNWPSKRPGCGLPGRGGLPNGWLPRSKALSRKTRSTGCSTRAVTARRWSRIPWATWPPPATAWRRMNSSTYSRATCKYTHGSSGRVSICRRTWSGGRSNTAAAIRRGMQ